MLNNFNQIQIRWKERLVLVSDPIDTKRTLLFLHRSDRGRVKKNCAQLQALDRRQSLRWSETGLARPARFLQLVPRSRSSCACVTFLAGRPNYSRAKHLRGSDRLSLDRRRPPPSSDHACLTPFLVFLFLSSALGRTGKVLVLLCSIASC
jgi:hypothetical protein